MNAANQATSTTIQDPRTVSTAMAVARYVLLAERVVMGLFFVGFALNGLLGIVPSATGADAHVGGAGIGLLLKTGWLLPLLKGTEMLLEQYVHVMGKKSGHA